MRWVSELGRLSRIARLEIGLALAALAVALVTSVALTVSVLVQRQACYGTRLFKNPCFPVTPDVTLRLALVLLVVLALYAGALLAAWGQHRAQESSARTTAFMGMVTCVILLLAMTLSAVSGPGFYLLPSLVLLLAAVAVGIFAQIHGPVGGQAPRTDISAPPSEEPLGE
jgi:hypothetical protein